MPKHLPYRPIVPANQRMIDRVAKRLHTSGKLGTKKPVSIAPLSKIKPPKQL